MTTPQAAIERVQWHLGRLSGVKQAPDYPPESMSQFPFGLAYLRDGNATFEAGWIKDVYTIVCELHFARQVLPADIAKAMPYNRLMLTALHGDPTLNGTVDTIISPVEWRFGLLTYGADVDRHLGWRWAITVKQQTVAN